MQSLSHSERFTENLFESHSILISITCALSYIYQCISKEYPNLITNTCQNHIQNQYHNNESFKTALIYKMELRQIKRDTCKYYKWDFQIRNSKLY